MSDLLEKAGLIGLGLVSLTEKKAKQLAEELVREGEVTRKEAQAFSRNLMKKADQSRKDLKKNVESITRALLDRMNLATKKDLNDLERKLRAAIEKKKKRPARKKK